MKFIPRPTHSDKLSRAVCLASVLVAMLTIVSADAQTGAAKPTIPSETYQITTPFTTAQQQGVQAYIDFYLNALVNGPDVLVVDAREQLVSPLSKGGSQEFNTQYAALLSAALPAAKPMESQRHPFPPDDPEAQEQRGGVIVRLNTMIIVSRLPKDEPMAALILRGVEDENPAVRYWAAGAVRSGVEALPDAPRQQLIAALQKAAGTERVEEVLRMLLGGMIGLEAVEPAAAALNDLIQLHVGQPSMVFDAKREAMRSLLQKLLEMRAKNLPVEPQFRQLARAACRYVLLIARQDQNAQLAEATINDHIEMLSLCDFVLRTIHEQLGAASPQPPNNKADLAGKNWSGLSASGLAWQQVLMQPPFSFAEADFDPAGSN